MTVSFIIPCFYGGQYLSSLVKMMEDNVRYAEAHGQDCPAEAVFINDNPKAPFDLAILKSDLISIKALSNEKNEGIHYSRVRGLGEASGEFICFLDQDDVISEQYLLSQITHIGGNDAVLCNGKVNDRIMYNDDSLRLAVDIDAMKEGRNRIWSPGQVLIKKDSIPDNWKNHILNNNGADDYYLWMMMLLSDKKIGVNKDILFIHRITGVNTSNDQSSMRKSVEEMAQHLQNDKFLSEDEYSAFIRARNRQYEEAPGRLPLLSIIIPVYNSERYLDKCIRSALGQMYQNIEVILVNDGSTDRSGEICDDYAGKDKRVIVIHKENGGSSSARAVGFKASRGEFICFLDNDDWIDPYMYKDMMDVLSRDSEVDIVIGGYVLEKEEGTLQKFKRGKERMLKSSEALKEMFRDELFNWSLCDKIYRRSLFERTEITRKWRPSYGEDTHTNWILFRAVDKIYYRPVYGYHYVIHKDSMMRQKCSAEKLVYFDLYSEILAEAVAGKEQELIKEIARAAIKACTFLLREAKSDGRVPADVIGKCEKQLEEYKEVLKKRFISEDMGMEDVNPKVSVIIPSHNSEKYIRQAVESVRAQVLSDIEIICIDSSTKDSTPEILKNFAAKDDRIRVIFDKKSSYGYKINKGIYEARGMYLAILEADDLLNQDSLQIMWEEVCGYEHKLDFIKGEYVSFYEEGEGITEDKIYHCSEDEYNRVYDYQNDINIWVKAWNRIWTGLYKLEFLRKNNIRLNESPGASYQDTGFSMLCNAYAQKVCFIPDTVYMYRTDNDSSSVKDDAKYMLIKEEFDWIEDQLRSRNLMDDRMYAACKAFKMRTYQWNMERLSDEYKTKFKEAIMKVDDNRVKVSVLVPSLNVKEYISQCIESIINQTLKEIEIICIDAGSTDGTLEILKEYEKTHNNIKVIISDKKSYGYQMNIGIKAARGEYIGIVETDDFIDEYMFSTLYFSAKWNDVEVAKSLTYNCFDYGKEGAATIPVIYYNDVLKLGRIIFPEQYPQIHSWDNNIWNGIYKRSFLEENNITFRETSGAAYQDIGFQQRVLNYAKDYICIPNYFYHYRKDRPGSSTVSDNCVKYIYGEYKDLIADSGLKKSRYSAVYERMIPAFLDEFEKYLMLAGFNKEKLNCMPEVEWFFGQTQNVIEGGILREDNTNPYRWQRIREFSKGIEEYIDSYKNKMQPLMKWFSAFKDKCGNNRVVIFGTGNYGQSLLLFLIRNGIIPAAMCDNNLAKQVCSYYGVRVFTPEDVVLKYPGASFLIAAKNNWKTMRAQLEYLGVSEQRIMVFNGEEDGIFDVLRQQPVIYEER